MEIEMGGGSFAYMHSQGLGRSEYLFCTVAPG